MTALHELVDLRSGTLDVSRPLSLEQLPARALIQELQTIHCFVFQERAIGKKTEIGIARKIAYELIFRRHKNSLLPVTRLYPILVDCYLISAYDDVLSEITWTRRINVRPVIRSQRELKLSFGRGHKLDRTVDGWQLKPLLRRQTKLSEQLLRSHGWQFDLLPPFHTAKP
jgi:hypothetical protein